MINNLENINKFIRNYNKMHNTSSANTDNVYHIISEDLNGNITNECFGLNVITNECMKKYQLQNVDTLYGTSMYDSASAGGMFLGVGSGTPAVTDTTLFTNSAYVTPVKDSSSYSNNNLPITYDSTTDIISQKVLIFVGVYDYNLTSITNDMVITEIGIGPSITNLYLHALVYDINGNVSSFTKHINEKISVYVYSPICIKSSILSDLYDNGVYACFEPCCLHKGYVRFSKLTKTMMCGTARLIGNNTYTYSKPNMSSVEKYTKSSLFGDSTDTTMVDGVYECNTQGVSTKYVLTDKYANIDKMAYCFRYTQGDFQGIWIRPTLGSGVTEDLESTIIGTNSLYDMGIDFNFGGIAPIENSDTNLVISQGHLPVNDITITSLKLYNYLTDAYDIDMGVVGNNYHPEARYGLNKYSVDGQYYTNYNILDLSYINGIGYVMVNENTTIPIKQFYCDNNNTAVIKATDTFWDPSSFVTINNKNSVPTELSQKRYYIFEKTFSRIATYRDRNQQYPTISPNESPRIVDSFTSITNNMVNNASSSTFVNHQLIASDELGYITNGFGLFYPETYDGTNLSSIKSYRFTSINDTSDLSFIDNTSNGDVIVRVSSDSVSSSKQNITLIHVGDSTTTPVVDTVSYVSTQTFVPIVSLSREHGIISIQYMTSATESGTTSSIIRIYDDGGAYNPTITHFTNTKFCRVIFGTTKYVYLDLTDGSNLCFNVKDALTDTIENTFTLDNTKYTIIDGIIGWKNHIWVSVYSVEFAKYVTIYYDINSSSIQILNDFNSYNLFTFFRVINDSSQSQVSYIDECMCVSEYSYYGKTLSSTRYGTYVFTDNNVINPTPLSVNVPDSVKSFYPYYNGYSVCTNRYTQLKVKKVNNNKNIVLLKLNTYNHNLSNVIPTLNDIGYIIKNTKPITDNVCKEGSSYSLYDDGNRTLGSNVCTCLYKDSVHKVERDKWSRFPFEAFELMKLTGSTKTIQSYNNPKGISFDNFPIVFGVTNNSSKWS